MNTHIDQLAQWYEDAERITKTNLPNDGDSVIYPRLGGGGYIIETSTEGWTPSIVQDDENRRILSRAPKPRPAWHDAVAVIATFRDDCGMVTGVWVQEGKPGYWEGPEGDVVASELLEDVTPLIETRVTREMTEQARDAAREATGVYWERSLVSRMLTAALGITPDTK